MRAPALAVRGNSHLLLNHGQMGSVLADTLDGDGISFTVASK
jgi:hypothetical protein